MGWAQWLLFVINAHHHPPVICQTGALPRFVHIPYVWCIRANEKIRPWVNPHHSIAILVR